MKKFSPPQMKEVSFPTPHTLFQVSFLKAFLNKPINRP
ncbi:hypothetical protein O53_3669 [Microcystis aeruginosa TAIHU98]|uniref:Uncharacterized protein n=2 Tax=Microcystis aeruginosa TaxID=1126 RepID=L7E723_MICAE|nr:hypothetical protein BH695_4455 [Microcystis aeruginosa PCC 7806SL]ELP54844.1 hypothetical protein O53_3669 [Microcystis aeruginosa TAIHU98]ODV40337.1 DNA gyrase subunit A [Microcystis aeruginosa NIES-98]